MPRSLPVAALILILFGLLLAGQGYFAGPAPAFSLPETGGGQVDLASFAGRPVLLVFWTTSCPICQHELPILNRMEPEFRNKGISVVTVLLGSGDEAENYTASNGISLRTLYDSRGTAARAYGVSGVPKLVLIDKEGKVRRSSSGWTDESTLRGWMDAV